jgi:SAM-dependent methyltransferase
MKEPPNFDRVALAYRWAEYLALGTMLERTREHFLPQLMDRRHAAVFGDGDGRFLSKLMKENAGLSAVAVDLSGDMLVLLRGRCRFAAERLRTVQDSVMAADVEAETDLVVTHFFLDCLLQEEVDELVRRVGSVVGTGALWVVSDFAVPASGAVRLPARAYIRSLYFAFRVLTGLRVTRLPDPQSALAREGFRRIERKERLWGMLYTELWQRR